MSADGNSNKRFFRVLNSGRDTERTVWGSKVPMLKGTDTSLPHVQCFLYLVSSINVSIFHTPWLDTFWTYLIQVYKISIDRVQDTPPQNIMPWCVDYFKLKEFEKIDAGMTLWPSPKASHNTLRWEVPSLHPDERTIFVSKTEGLPKGIWRKALLNFPKFTTLSSYPFGPITFFHDFPVFIKCSTKTYRFNLPL